MTRNDAGQFMQYAQAGVGMDHQPDVPIGHACSLVYSGPGYGEQWEAVKLRTLLLFLSRQKRLRKWMETSVWARRLSGRFVAGDTLPEALVTCQRINAEGIAVTLDHLGENVGSSAEAACSRDAYMQALAEIVEAGNQRQRLSEADSVWYGSLAC